MKLEQQVVSLELAKKLKELGVDQYEAAFKWQKGYFFIESVSDPKTNKVEETGWKVKDNGVMYTTGQEVFKWWYPEVQKIEAEQYAAFTSTELGEMLPLYLKKDADRGISFSVETCGLHIYKAYDNSGWIVHYLHDSISAKTLADAMAKMLIYLIKNGLCPSPSKT